MPELVGSTMSKATSSCTRKVREQQVASRAQQARRKNPPRGSCCPKRDINKDADPLRGAKERRSGPFDEFVYPRTGEKPQQEQEQLQWASIASGGGVVAGTRSCATTKPNVVPLPLTARGQAINDGNDADIASARSRRSGTGRAEGESSARRSSLCSLTIKKANHCSPGAGSGSQRKEFPAATLEVHRSSASRSCRKRNVGKNETNTSSGSCATKYTSPSNGKIFRERTTPKSSYKAEDAYVDKGSYTTSKGDAQHGIMNGYTSCTGGAATPGFATPRSSCASQRSSVLRAAFGRSSTSKKEDVVLHLTNIGDCAAGRPKKIHDCKNASVSHLQGGRRLHQRDHHEQPPAKGDFERVNPDLWLTSVDQVNHDRERHKALKREKRRREKRRQLEKDREIVRLFPPPPPRGNETPRSDELGCMLRAEPLAEDDQLEVDDEPRPRRIFNRDEDVERLPVHHEHEGSRPAVHGVERNKTKTVDTKSKLQTFRQRMRELFSWNSKQDIKKDVDQRHVVKKTPYKMNYDDGGNKGDAAALERFQHLDDKATTRKTSKRPKHLRANLKLLSPPDEAGEERQQGVAPQERVRTQRKKITSHHEDLRNRREQVNSLCEMGGRKNRRQQECSAVGASSQAHRSLLQRIYSNIATTLSRGGHYNNTSTTSRTSLTPEEFFQATPLGASRPRQLDNVPIGGGSGRADRVGGLGHQGPEQEKRVPEAHGLLDAGAGSWNRYAHLNGDALQREIEKSRRRNFEHMYGRAHNFDGGSRKSRRELEKRSNAAKDDELLNVHRSATTRTSADRDKSKRGTGGGRDEGANCYNSKTKAKKARPEQHANKALSRDERDLAFGEGSTSQLIGPDRIHADNSKGVMPAMRGVEKKSQGPSTQIKPRGPGGHLSSRAETRSTRVAEVDHVRIAGTTTTPPTSSPPLAASTFQVFPRIPMVQSFAEEDSCSSASSSYTSDEDEASDQHVEHENKPDEAARRADDQFLHDENRARTPRGPPLTRRPIQCEITPGAASVLLPVRPAEDGEQQLRKTPCHAELQALIPPEDHRDKAASHRCTTTPRGRNTNGSFSPAQKKSSEHQPRAAARRPPASVVPETAPTTEDEDTGCSSMSSSPRRSSCSSHSQRTCSVVSSSSSSNIDPEQDLPDHPHNADHVSRRELNHVGMMTSSRGPGVKMSHRGRDVTGRIEVQTSEDRFCTPCGPSESAFSEPTGQPVVTTDENNVAVAGSNTTAAAEASVAVVSRNNVSPSSCVGRAPRGSAGGTTGRVFAAAPVVVQGEQERTSSGGKTTLSSNLQTAHDNDKQNLGKELSTGAVVPAHVSQKSSTTSESGRQQDENPRLDRHSTKMQLDAKILNQPVAAAPLPFADLPVAEKRKLFTGKWLNTSQTGFEDVLKANGANFVQLVGAKLVNYGVGKSFHEFSFSGGGGRGDKKNSGEVVEQTNKRCSTGGSASSAGGSFSARREGAKKPLQLKEKHTGGIAGAHTFHFTVSLLSLRCIWFFFFFAML